MRRKILPEQSLNIRDSPASHASCVRCSSKTISWLRLREPFLRSLALDHRICLYIRDCFTQNPKPGKRQKMVNLLSILHLMIPSLRGNHLGLSKRCLTSWRALRPSKSSVPFPKHIALALFWFLLRSGKPKAACILFKTFCGYLRVSEALALCINDIAPPGDVRLASYGPRVAGLNIRDVKAARYTGSLQFVRIDDTDAIQFLQACISSSNKITGPLVRLTYQTYATDLKEALAALGLQNALFTSHSARIGKATQDYVADIPVDQIAVNGRWKSLHSLQYYVTTGRAWLLDTKIPPATQQ